MTPMKELVKEKMYGSQNYPLDRIRLDLLDQSSHTYSCSIQALAFSLMEPKLLS
jgi:hypothetical protein